MATRREQELSYDEYFMCLATWAATSMGRRIGDSGKVGALIHCPDRKVVATGWNGPPVNVAPDDHDNPWCEAETNALFYRSTPNVHGHTMYVTRFPTLSSAKLIAQSKISEICYRWRKGMMIPDDTLKFLEEAKIKRRRITLGRQYNFEFGGDSLDDTSNLERYDNFAMGIALIASYRSKYEPKEGAVICGKFHKIVGIGWNGMPQGMEEGEDANRGAMCDAAVNACLFRTVASLNDCRMYVTYTPSVESAKWIKQANVKEVVIANKWKDNERRIRPIRNILGNIIRLIKPPKVISIEDTDGRNQTEN